MDAVQREEQHACERAGEALLDVLQRHVADPLTRVEKRGSEASVGLWVTMGGTEYFVMVKPSAKQRYLYRKRLT